MDKVEERITVVGVQFSPLGKRTEFFCPWQETKVGDFVVGRAGLGDSVGRVMSVRHKAISEKDKYPKLTRKATNNETYEGEEVFNLKHTVAYEKKTIKLSDFQKQDGGEQLKEEKAEEKAFSGESIKEIEANAKEDQMLRTLRIAGIGIGLLAALFYKEELLELLGL